MKLIKPSFEIWEQPSGLEGVYKQIEREQAEYAISQRTRLQKILPSHL